MNQQILCAKCSYDIYGVGHTGNCPECSHPVQDSILQFNAMTMTQQVRDADTLDLLVKTNCFTAVRDGAWLLILLLAGPASDFCCIILLFPPLELIVHLCVVTHTSVLGLTAGRIGSWVATFCLCLFIVYAIYLFSSGNGVMDLIRSPSINPALLTMLFVYYAARAVTWVCVLRHACRLSRQIFYGPGVLWQIAITLTLIAPFLGIVAWFLYKNQNLTYLTTVTIPSTVASLLGSLAVICASWRLLRRMRPYQGA